jgi:Fe-S-cluster containining protein
MMDLTPEQYQAALDAFDPVTCGGCTACCKGGQAVELRPDRGDNLDDYPHRAMENLAGVFKVVLARRPNGDCIHLGKNGCEIYDKRPTVCRTFDCRRMIAGATKQERRELVALGVFSKRIMEAAKERLATFKPLDGEEKFLRFQTQFLLNRARHGEVKGLKISEQQREALRG